ncbi:MAG: hypothetical protein K0S04_3983 [Herbinix sp.]|jgi:hypothetical protein|nr:hypothetical protein [Herbinix sp.]
MKCNTCGRQLQNEEANFCEYCGASFREHTHTIINALPHEHNSGETADMNHRSIAMQMPEGVIGQRAVNETVADKPISFMNWLGTYALMFIPFVGVLVFIIMLFVWAFGGKVPESKKNWARVNLIVALVIFLLLFLYLITLVSSPMFQDMFQQMMNGTFDYNSYYNGLYQNSLQ